MIGHLSLFIVTFIAATIVVLAHASPAASACAPSQVAARALTPAPANPC
jgi:hypothetical protein